MDYYNAMLADHQNQTVKQKVRDDGKVQTLSGTGEARVVEITLLNEQDQPVEVVNVGQCVKLKVVVEAKSAIQELVLGYMIRDRLGQPMFGTNTYHLKRKLADIPKGMIKTFLFEFAVNLGQGTYSITTALHTGDTHIGKNYEWRDFAAIFSVVNIDKETFTGTAWLPPTMECF